MNSFGSARRTCPLLSGVAILRLRPAACPDVYFMPLPGPGSGSLREFIKKIDSERSSKLLLELSQAKNATYERNFVFFSDPTCVQRFQNAFYFFSPESNIMSPGVIPRRLQSSAYKAR
jgi:hypothetical protein